jgi:hypothetical protein
VDASVDLSEQRWHRRFEATSFETSVAIAEVLLCISMIAACIPTSSE